MNNVIIRSATVSDVPYLTKTIIEAEKSGTTILSYSTIFGLNEEQVFSLISEMLLEEIDHCEISISSFLIAEINGKTAAALSGWLENADEIPSAVLKGNLLNYYLPKECFIQASLMSKYTKELHFDYMPNTFQIGAGYVSAEYRGQKLLGLLTRELINDLHFKNTSVTEIYAQIFNCNIPSLKTYENEGFTIIDGKESIHEEIVNILPSPKKLLLKKNLKP